jgi:hypothetical protein
MSIFGLPVYVFSMHGKNSPNQTSIGSEYLKKLREIPLLQTISAQQQQLLFLA